MSLEISRKEEIKSYKIGWNLERQLAWAGLFLATLIGLFEILINNEKPYYTSFRTLKSIDIINIYSILYLFLIFGILITLSQLFKLIVQIRNEELELKALNKYWSFDPRELSPIMKLIANEEKINEHYKCTKNSQNIRLILYLVVFACFFAYSFTLFDFFKLNWESQLILFSFIKFISLIGMKFDICYNSYWN